MCEKSCGTCEDRLGTSACDSCGDNHSNWRHDCLCTGECLDFLDTEEQPPTDAPAPPAEGRTPFGLDAAISKCGLYWNQTHAAFCAIEDRLSALESAEKSDASQEVHDCASCDAAVQELSEMKAGIKIAIKECEAAREMMERLKCDVKMREDERDHYRKLYDAETEALTEMHRKAWGLYECVQGYRKTDRWDTYFDQSGDEKRDGAFQDPDDFCGWVLARNAIATFGPVQNPAEVGKNKTCKTCKYEKELTFTCDICEKSGSEWEVEK